jgi:hypothetical protein
MRVSLLRTLAATAGLLVVATAAAAAESSPVFTAARAAVTDNHVEKTKPLGGYDAKRAFTEMPPQGALLVGFECGVGKFGNIDCVYALRPLYLTADGVDSYQEFGLFADRRLPKNKVIKTRVVKSVHIEARPGYAVGGLTLRAGLCINGLSVTFMKIKGRALDPTQSYTSDWVGDRTGGREASVDADGALVVGVYGSQDDDHVFGLGLIHALELPPAPKPEPVPEETPAVEPPTKPAVPAKPAKPAARPQKPPVDDDPPEREWVEPVTQRPSAPPAPEPAAQPVPPSPSRWTAWVPYVIFGFVMVVVLTVGLVFYGATRLLRAAAPAAQQAIPELEEADAPELEEAPFLEAADDEGQKSP